MARERGSEMVVVGGGGGGQVGERGGVIWEAKRVVGKKGRKSLKRLGE